MWSILENNLCALKNNVYFLVFGCKVLKILINIIWSNMSFQANITLSTFCLDDLSMVVNGVFRFLFIVVFLSVSPLMYISNCFIYCGAPKLVAYILMYYIFVMNCPCYHYKMSIFVYYLSCIEIYFSIVSTATISSLDVIFLQLLSFTSLL